VNKGNMLKSVRVLEHAVRLVRKTFDSTSVVQPGKLTGELENYVKRLKGLEKAGRTQEFYRVLRNTHKKLIDLVCKTLR
jgi:hypothetical protein